MHLSVVLPNYNHSALLVRAIVAITEQTQTADEIVVVDDASTDNSIQVLAGLQTRCPILRVLRNESNIGAIASINRGVKEAAGEYVYLAAADDWTRPGFFARMIALLQRYPRAAFACCEGVVVDTSTKKAEHRPPVRPAYSDRFFEPNEVATALRRIDNWILTGASIIKRGLIMEAGCFDSRLGAFADGYMMRRLALQHGYCFAPYSGLVWEVSNEGLSRALAGNPQTSLRVLSTAVEQMRRDPVFPAWYPDLFARRWRFAVGRIAIESRPMNIHVLNLVSARGPVARRLFALASKLGLPFGRLIALAWLSLAERPTSFSGLVKTRWSRLWEGKYRKLQAFGFNRRL